MEYTKTNFEQEEQRSKKNEEFEEKPVEPASLGELYRYITGKYKLMLVIAIINAFIGGGCNPARILLVRDSFGEVSDNDVLKDMAEGFRDKVKWLGMIAAIGGICCYIFCMIFIIIGAKISYELKWRYLKAVLSQDCAWYERQNIEELPTQINVNIAEVENATGKTSGFIIYSFGALCAGVGIAFFIGGVLACTYLAIIPYVLICGMSRGKLLSKGNEEIEKAYEKSGADAEEALQNIRVVKAFGQESSEINKFVNHLSQADNKVHKYSFLFGITCGMVESVLYVIQSYALMIGGFIIAGGVTNKNVDRTYNLGDVMGASISIFIGALFFGASAMNIQTLKRGLVCAGSILHVIDRVPPININDPDAESFDESIEEIKLENVSFKYEGRNNKVLDRVSLNFKNSKMTALVGPSGCGKSTIVRLLERFYDPTEGKIFVNSKDLKTLNLQQYRRKIGYVGQEPCLLNETIKDNLLNGNPDATDAEIIEALKLAHAYDFVMKLPQGIETNVGGVGGKLSGGQKQRIAIARALLKKPDLLILDEATSALDSENERAVQAAIDNIGRTHSITTVVIAHRLSTIFNSDFIYVLNEGKVVEMGDHKSLINEKGLYYSYFKSQEISNSVFDKKQNKIDEDVDKSDDKILLVENHVKVDDQKEMGSLEILKKLLPYSNPKILIFVLFITCSIVAAALPIIAIYIVKCLFAYLRHTPNHMRTEMSKYCSVIFGVGVLVFTLQAINRYSLQIFSFSMTKMIRQDLYKSLINQSIPFYEKKKNSTGQLTGILAKDSRVVNGASFELYILVFQGFVGIISGVVVGFIHEWNLGLVILGLLPSTAFCAYFLLVVQVTPPPKASKYTDYERTVISDSISNYSTILSLAYQDKYVERYYDCDEKRDHKMNLKVDLWRTHWFCVAYGASNSLINGYVIPMLYVMASNVEDGNNICDQFICLVAGIFGSLSLSLAMFNAPDYNKGKESAIKVFKMINRPQEGEQASLTPNGSRDISPDEANGDIEFHNVWFKYPSSEVWVLKDFSFKINGQESVGFVGESGCGKSTVTLLLLRFYEPNKGFITIGNTKITEFSIKSLRSIFGLVQQEPIIFNCSIMENILYGKPYATAEEVKKAAELANASSFIDKLTSDENLEFKSFEIATNETDPRYSELSEGYKIICGHKGAKLSGGQKQRIAIARALIRNPRILLLDEATSALDEKTQIEVQQTLDEISNTTTSIVIAHRKSTLSNCDRIVQIYDGVIMNSN